MLPLLDHPWPMACTSCGRLSSNGCVLVQGLPLETYVAAYKYGSVVIFNGREREKEVLKLCQEFCTEPTKQNYTEGAAVPLHGKLTCL